MIKVKDILTVTKAPGKRSILRKEYENFFRKLKFQVIRVDDKLPYETEHNNDNCFVVFVKFKSSSCPRINYDVVIQVLGERLSPDTRIRVYNNNPSFVYQLAYLFYKTDSLLFAHYYGIKVLTIAPRKRNPYSIIEADKYTYAGVKVIQKLRLNKNSMSQFRGPWSSILNPYELEKKIKQFCK